MLEFQHKRRIRKMMYSPVALVILAIIAAVFVKAAWNVHAKEAQSQVYLDQAQSQLDDLSSQEQGLKQSVAALNTKEGMDAEIRSEYLVVKPGEQVAVIVDSPAASDTASSTESSGGFWARFAEFFGF
jgi:cell division protein FtsB